MDWGLAFVDGGDHNQGCSFAEQGVGTVLQFTSGIAFREDVGRFFEFERTFTGNRIVHVSTDKEEAGLVAEGAGDVADVALPAGKLLGDRGRQARKFCEGVGERGSLNGAPLLRREQRQQIQIEQLSGKAFSGRYGALRARCGRKRNLCGPGHGGAGNIGDGHGRAAHGVGFAQRHQGIGGFAGLRHDEQGRVFQGVVGAVEVLTAVFHIDGNAAGIFQHQFANLAGMTTGPAGSNHDFASGV